MSKVFIEESTLTAIGDAIRSKTGGTDAINVTDMATTISGITTGEGGSREDFVPDSAFAFSGDCSYRFANNGWNWFIEKYGDKITTSDITNATMMCGGCTEIPFDINLMNYDTINGVSCERLFYYSTNITTIPYVRGSISNLTHMFNNCQKLREIPDDWANYIDWEYMHTYAYTSMGYMFNSCHSLRKVPSSLLSQLWGISTGSSYSPYYQTYGYCYCLDELNGLAVHKGTYTTNRFSGTFNSCYRLKDLTFELQEDGTPYTASWKSQTIDLTVYPFGYSNSSTSIMNYNSGITADKEVYDDETYQALKDNPDWWTTDIAYSRYNHDSAVNTINSLPDTSAYLASAGGTNTIKFEGASGSATDGGAINTLTEEEIAVATAKGWTVTIA